MKSTYLLIFALAVSNSICGMTVRKSDDRQPEVIEATMPVYSPRALSAHATGAVVVEVTIDSKGLVESVRAISGNAILMSDSKRTARSWRFAPETERSPSRRVQLTFVYRLLPKDAAFNQLLPVFKLPYRVEIAHVIPAAETTRLASK